MLQIKVFYLFILAAAPAATLPLPTVSDDEYMKGFHERNPDYLLGDPLAGFLHGGGGTSQ